MSIFKRTIKSSSFSTTAIACVLFLSSAIFTTAQTKIPRSEWTGGVNVPNYITMQIYIPKKIATKPPIIVSCHACGTKVSGQVGANPKIIAAAEKNGFLNYLPGKSGK
jgi:poly(3-hydroxybutyrate) depolymerase